jgi:hypothetical protein
MIWNTYRRLDSGMCSRSLAVAILLASASVVSALPNATEPLPPNLLSADYEIEIRALETSSWAAWQNRDADFFEQFLSDDHVDVHSFGVTGKRSVVDGVRSPLCVVKNYSIGPLTLTAVSADTVLVTYRAEQDTTCGKVRVPSPVWATSLYARRAGRWVNVLYQQTPLSRQ